MNRRPSSDSRPLLPPLWPDELESVRLANPLRKLTVAEASSGNSEITGRGLDQLSGIALWRKGNDDILVREQSTDGIYGRSKVAITRYEECNVDSILVCVSHQFDGNADISHLLIVNPLFVKAVRTEPRRQLVLTEENLAPRGSLKSFNIGGLSPTYGGPKSQDIFRGDLKLGSAPF